MFLPGSQRGKPGLRLRPFLKAELAGQEIWEGARQGGLGTNVICSHVQLGKPASPCALGGWRAHGWRTFQTWRGVRSLHLTSSEWHLLPGRWVLLRERPVSLEPPENVLQHLLSFPGKKDLGRSGVESFGIFAGWLIMEGCLIPCFGGG